MPLRTDERATLSCVCVAVSSESISIANMLPPLIWQPYLRVGAFGRAGMPPAPSKKATSLCGGAGTEAGKKERELGDTRPGHHSTKASEEPESGKEA
jgi:hypothetical protein